MCTVFMLPTESGRFMLGKNYDTPDPCYGMIFSNQRDIQKTALILKPDTPKQWKSSFGSVTFSQVGKEFPSCGMNQAGLIVEQTTLWNTVYPDKDERPALKELQWIQYMLDTCSTVDQVTDRLQELRIAQDTAKIQYFVCDLAGNTALIEYILGQEVVFRENTLPYAVIANDMYQTSLDYLSIHRGYGGTKQPKRSEFSLDRFAVTVDEICHTQTIAMENAVETGFSVLQQSEFNQTQWQMVYQPDEQVVWYKSKRSPELKRIALGQFDFSCTESYVKDIDALQSEAFTTYSTEINYRLAKSFFATSLLGKSVKISEELLAGFARYPETLTRARHAEQGD